jgi:dTDP-4-amino-4,6-dideoxygalactose transaminase
VQGQLSLTQPQQEELASLARAYCAAMQRFAAERREIIATLEATLPRLSDCGTQSRESIASTAAANSLTRLLSREHQVHAEYLTTSLDKARTSMRPAAF